MSFRRQNYIVLKLKDVTKYLSPQQQQILGALVGEITIGRFKDDKAPMQCVVVEADWPEYEPTWNAIERRISASDSPKPFVNWEGLHGLLAHHYYLMEVEDVGNCILYSGYDGGSGRSLFRSGCLIPLHHLMKFRLLGEINVD